MHVRYGTSNPDRVSAFPLLNNELSITAKSTTKMATKLQYQLLSLIHTSRIRSLAPKLFFRPSHRPLSAYGYTQSKALVYHTPGPPSTVLNLHSSALSPPHASLVTLRFLVSPINPADINTIEGTYPLKPPLSPDLGGATVGGGEGLAEVLAVGGDVKSLSRGDWVLPAGGRWACGSWRTNAQVQAQELVKIEKRGVEKLFAGSVGVNPLTALVMLRQSGLEKGDWFVQNGANSAVGTMAAQIGKVLGLKSIAVVRRRDTEAETQALKDKLLEAGATVVATDAELGEADFKDRVASWTSGSPRGVRLALNCTGGRSVLSMAKTLGKGATVLTYGAMARQPLPPVPFSLMVFRDIRFRGFWLSRWAREKPELQKEWVQELLEWHRQGLLQAPAIEEIMWNFGTEEPGLKEAVARAMLGFRKGKPAFVFGDDTG